MPQSDKRQSAEDTDVQVLIIVERIEGKVDRVNDRVKLNSENVATLLDVVTGVKSGGSGGLVMRVRDLESRQDRIEEALREVKEINGRMDTMEKSLNQALQMQTDHPPLLYMLRFNTRRTMMWIIILFIILSLIWASDIRDSVFSMFVPGF